MRYKNSHCDIFSFAYLDICLSSSFSGKDPEQVRSKFSPPPLQIGKYLLNSWLRCISSVSDHWSPSSCTGGTSPRMPPPNSQSPRLKLRCAILAFQRRLNFPPWSKFRDHEAEQGSHVVPAEAEEAPLLGALAHPEAAHVCAPLQGTDSEI